MDIHETIQRIGYFRNKLKISARELSLRIGKHESYINKLESKDFNLPTNILLEIINALEITPDEFFAKNYQSYKVDNELIDLIMAIPFEKRKNIIDFLKK